MEKNMRMGAGLFFLLFLFSWSVSWGYEEIQVTGGGTVTGRVVLKGPPPPARIFHLVTFPNPDFCGQISDGRGNRLVEEFRVAEDGGFEDVVVIVVGVEKGKRFDLTPEVTIEHCRVSPFVVPARNYHPFSFVNKDPISHAMRAYSLKGSHAVAMFSTPLIAGSTVSKEIRLKKGYYLFNLECGVHAFMRSWGIGVGNPYFAVTTRDGSFTIPDLPPGAYDVVAWHPHMEIQAQQVTVPEGGRAILNFEFDASEADIPLYDLQTGYRFDTFLDANQAILPSVEIQSPKP